MSARRNLVGLAMAVAAAFCIAGGMALTAFADSEPTAQGAAVQYWYHDDNGTLHEDGSRTDYVVVSAESTAWGTSGQETWYVASGDVRISDRITVSGTVNLILCDGATLTASKGIAVAKNSVLNIYAQSEGANSGRLVAGDSNDGCDERYAGIGGNGAESRDCGTVVVHGGDVTVTGGDYAAGIGGGYEGDGGVVTVYGGAVTATGGSGTDGKGGAGIGSGNNDGDWPYQGGTVTVYGGTVTATGGEHAAGIGGGRNGRGGTVTIDGGVVTANGGKYGAGIGSGDRTQGNGSSLSGTVTINGGTVTATGGSDAAGIGGGNRGKGATVTVNGGTVAATGDNWAAGIGGGAYGDGGEVTVNGGTVTATGGSEAQMFRAAGIGGGHGGANVTGSGTLQLGEAVALYGGDSAETKALFVARQSGLYDGDRCRFMEIAPADDVQSVPYQAWDDGDRAVKDVAGGCTGYYMLNTSTITLGDGKWYVVTGNVVIAERITVSGTAHLILCDGATLTASKGVYVIDGNTLNIYAQDAGEGAGALIATGDEWAAGIGGGNNNKGGTVNIHGGTVTATGGNYAAGIGGGSVGAGGAVNIYGGTVTATGGHWGAGIGGGNEGDGGEVSIYGGTVTATGVDDARAMGVGHGVGRSNNGGLNLAGADVALVVSSNNTSWSAYSSTDDNRAQYMKSAGTASVVITGGDHATASGDLQQAVTVTRSMKEVTFTADAGYIFESFVNREVNGVTMTRTSETTVKVSGAPMADVSITVPKAVPAPVTYLEWDAAGAKMESVKLGSNDYYVVDATTKKLKDDKPYVVSSDVTISDRIELEGNEAQLIICDRVTLTANRGIDLASTDALSVYPGSTGSDVAGTGVLVATGSDNDAGIGGGNDGFGGGAVVIHGGTVEATGGINAAGIGGGNGSANAGYAGNGCAVTVHGGTVKAAGGANAVGIGAGCKGGSHGTLTLNEDRALYGGDSAEAKALRATHLVAPYDGGRYSYMEIGAAADVEPVPYQKWDQESKTVKDVADGCTSYIAMDANVTALGNGNWYVVSGEVLASSRITVTGEANLILCDGATLTASEGIQVADNDSDPSNGSVNILNIYAQSAGADKGKLVADASRIEGVSNDGFVKGYAGIGGNNTENGGAINIHGGNVTATGGSGGAGIGGGNKGNGGAICIYGGTVTTAAGQGGMGIGSGDGGSAQGSLTLGADLALYGGNKPNPTALAEKGEIQSATYYLRSRYMTAIDAVEGVKAAIDKLPVANKVATTDQEIIVNARKAYNALTASQRTKLGKAALDKLEAAQKALFAKVKVTFAKTSYTYTGKVLTPAPTVKLGSATLKKNTDYTVSYKKNTNVGTATVTITGKGNYKGTTTATFKISVAANALTVKVATKSVKASNKAQVVAPITKVTPKFKAKVTYAKATTAAAKKLNGYKNNTLTVNKSTGKVTVKKGTKAGTYKLMVNVTAAKTDNTKAATKAVTVTVKVTGKAVKAVKAQSTKLVSAGLQ